MSDTPKFDDTVPHEAAPKFEDTTGPAFDDTEAVDTSPSKGESAMRGAANGMTAGFADEGAAGLGALKDWASAKLGNRGDISLTDAYKAWHKVISERDKEAEKANPKSFLGGQVAGGIGSAVVGPGALNAGKGAGLATIAGKSALAGGVAGYGNSDAATLGGDLKNAAAGAGVGAVAGPLAHGITSGVSSALGGLGDFAENRAAAALGWTKAMRNKFGNDTAKAAGRQGLDNGVVAPLASTADKLEGIQGVKDQAGKTIGGVMDKLDEHGLAEFNPIDVNAKLQRQFGPNLAEPINEDLIPQFSRLQETIAKRGSQNIPFAEAQKLKKIIGDRAYNDGVMAPGKELTAQGRGAVNEALDEAVDRGAAKLGDTELLSTLQGARGDYGLAKKSLKALGSKEAGEQGNNMLSLPTKVLAAGGGPAAIAKAVANTVGNKYGSNMLAVGADKLAKILGSSPEILGRYAGPLAQAAARGPAALSAAHAALLKMDPNYAKVIGDVP